jgi:hypothetical protein
LTPAEKALFAFDVKYKVEPARTVAVRIALLHGFTPASLLVDDIAHAIEDARVIGEKRGAFKTTEE